MPNDEQDHANGLYSESSSPPKTTNVTSLLNQYADAAKRCGEPGSLPDEYRTDEVSRRYRIPWAANHEDRTLAAIMTVRNMTEEDMEHFKEDLEKSAADWERQHQGQAEGGESELGEAENDTEVATKTAERDKAESRRTGEERSWAARKERISRREQKLSMGESGLRSRKQAGKVRETNLSRGEKSLSHRAQRLSRREARLTTREDMLSRGEKALREARRRLEDERQSMGEPAGWTGTSTDHGGDRHIPRPMIHLSIPESSRGSITIKYD
jgi:hypothetical protein